VLVGGHAPINTGYAFGTNDGRAALGLSDAFRDPSFEVFTPPNLFYGPRPVIGDHDPSLGYGATTRIEVTDAHEIESVVLVRNPALTHLIDGDQKVVELPVVSRDARSVTVATPPSANVAPPGPYWLFANRTTARGATPSVSRQVYLGAPVPEALREVIAGNAERSRKAELAERKKRGRGPRSGRAELDTRVGGVPLPTSPPSLPGSPGDVPAPPALPVPDPARAVEVRPVSATRKAAPYALLPVAALVALLVRRRARAAAR
jgi:hypothetical protein